MRFSVGGCAGGELARAHIKQKLIKRATNISICLAYLLAAVLKVSEVRVTSSASNEAQANF
ncbi:hypothetical protein [Campylobacter sp.]|uniref:hypothetical protein n=1 Tax=Campylobacter sp. TaxID=205 RepID=UPI002AA61207|nr:hypothetical protein [Campylobacter sp.]MCI6565336.1 hypothetical protein [Campylobacter sp.]MCI6578915.1 hypothetical protein [Campylobacter sp.]